MARAVRSTGTPLIIWKEPEGCPVDTIAFELADGLDAKVHTYTAQGGPSNSHTQACGSFR